MHSNFFFFPFAGGSSYSFEYYRKYTAHNFYTLEYPGRGKKIKLPLMDNIHQITNDVFNDLSVPPNTPFYFYGHSMGTLTAYLLIKELTHKKLPLPSHLFVSARGGPSSLIKNIRHNLPQDKFWKKIKDLGGCPQEILTNQDLMLFFEPILRADLKAIETYEYKSSEPFNIPITVLLGKNDSVSHEEAMLWQKETSQPIDIHYFDGGHFFIFDHIKEISSLMNAKITSNNKLNRIS